MTIYAVKVTFLVRLEDEGLDAASLEGIFDDTSRQMAQELTEDLLPKVDFLNVAVEEIDSDEIEITVGA